MTSTPLGQMLGPRLLTLEGTPLATVGRELVDRALGVYSVRRTSRRSTAVRILAAGERLKVLGEEGTSLGSLLEEFQSTGLPGPEMRRVGEGLRTTALELDEVGKGLQRVAVPMGPKAGPDTRALARRIRTQAARIRSVGEMLDSLRNDEVVFLGEILRGLQEPATGGEGSPPAGTGPVDRR